MFLEFLLGALHGNVRMVGCFGVWMIKLWVFWGVSLWNFILTCMVWWCVLGLKIYNSHLLHVGSVLPCLKTLGEIKCRVRFSVPRDPMNTLSPVWSSGKGSSSLVWSIGRGLVRVLNSLLVWIPITETLLWLKVFTLTKIS